MAESMAGQSQLLIYRDQRPGDAALILARDAVLTTLLSNGSVTANAYTALRTATERAAWRWSAPPVDQRHQGAVNSVAFSPDGERIVSAGEDGTIRLWTGAERAPLQRLFGHLGYVLSVAFSPDGQRIVSAGDDSTVRLWDGQSGEPLAQLDGHSGGVWSVAFSPDGQRIVSAGDDSTVRLWESPQRLLLQAMLAIGRPAPILTGEERKGFGLTGEERLPGQAELWPLLQQAQLLQRMERGRVLARSGNLAAAAAEFAAAQGLEPTLGVDGPTLARSILSNTVQSLIFAGRQLAKGGKLGEAEARFAQAAGLDGTLQVPQLMVQARQLAARALIEEARTLVQAGDLDAGLAKFEEAALLDSGLSIKTLQAEITGLVMGAHIEEARSLAQTGETPPAQAALERAVRLADGVEVVTRPWIAFCRVQVMDPLADLAKPLCARAIAELPRLDSGMAVTGTVTGATGDLWSLVIPASSQVTVTLSAGGSGLDVYLTLYNEQFEPVAQDDDSGENRDSALFGIRVVEAGQYWVEANGCCPGNTSRGTGAYIPCRQ